MHRLLAKNALIVNFNQESEEASTEPARGLSLRVHTQCPYLSFVFRFCSKEPEGGPLVQEPLQKIVEKCVKMHCIFFVASIS